MLDEATIQHLDHVSEGLPGPFTSRQGIGYIFAITRQSLLSHGLDADQIDGLLKRLLPQNLVHPWVSATVYRTRYADPHRNRRVLVFADLDENERTQDRQDDFLKDVNSIRSLLATLGFIAPESESETAHHPSRYRPMGTVTITEAQESGTDQRSGREQSSVTSNEFSATLGNIASRLRSSFRKENRRTQAQSAHESATQTSKHTQEYKFTGFEATEIVLSHIRETLGLRSPADLEDESSERALYELFSQSPPEGVGDHVEPRFFGTRPQPDHHRGA